MKARISPRAIALGVLLAAIISAGIHSLNIEQGKLKQKLTAVEATLDKERAVSKRNGLTWAEARRIISADVKLRQALRDEQYKLRDGSAYFQVMNQQFSRMAGEVPLFIGPETVLERARAEIAQQRYHGQKLIFYETEFLSSTVAKLEQQALQSGSSTRPVSATDFYSLKDSVLSQLRDLQSAYLDWFGNNQKLQKSIGQLTGFIRHNQLQKILSSELSALEDLEATLEQQNEQILVLFKKIELAPDTVSALHPLSR